MKKPIGLKRHVVSTIPVWALFHIISLGLFIIATGISDSCSFILGSRSYTSYFSLNSGFNVTSIQSVQDSCGNNTSVLTVAQNLGYINSTASLSNITNAALSAANFGIILNHLNAT